MTEVAGVVYDTFADKATYSPFVYKSFGSPMYNRFGKTGSFEPWSRVLNAGVLSAVFLQRQKWIVKYYVKKFVK